MPLDYELQIFENKKDIIRPQVGDEFKINPIFLIPWGHQKYIIDKCKSIPEALFYVQKTIKNGWSRAMLMNFIEAGLYHSQGKAVNNFDRLLPDVHSDLVKETLKDPYNFDFLTLKLELRCYVAIELKTGEFEPEYTGKLGYYIAAINNQLKKEVDNPTIGLLICKIKDNIDVQYSLESSSQPIGISAYAFSKLLPEDFQSSLPSIEEIEKELSQDILL